LLRLRKGAVVVKTSQFIAGATQEQAKRAKLSREHLFDTIFNFALYIIAAG